MASMADADPSLLLLLLPPASVSTAVPIVLLLLAAAALFSPGGIAWFLSRRRTDVAGPGGLAAGLALAGGGAHRALAALSHSLGADRLMAFSVGLTRFVVSSHPETAREILNSSAFADRPVKESARELLFNRAMGFAPFGEYWRNLRRISASHLFCPRRIAAFSERRRQIGEMMVEEVRDSMWKHGEVEVKRVFHFGSLNNVMVSVFGKSFDFRKGEGVELEEMVNEGYELLGVLNWSDHIPLLGWMDLQRVRRRSRVLVQKVNGFVGRIIAEHRMRRVNVDADSVGNVGDFVDVLLDFEKEEKLSDSDLIAVLWEMIFRGTDTVAILLEWIMARMVLHPEIQAEAQAEIDSAVGNSRPVSDSDIPNLRYLQSIVKETLRMHPPGPLLSWARLAIHDVNVGNHFIPAGTTAMVNMWAITHDKSIWADPNDFKPERFMSDEISIMGSDLRLAPFGSGRRVCPGKSMGLATVHLWLAQLLQSFKWVPSNGGVDLSERLRMSLEMENPLICCAIPRE
ncbi:Cytochrome P450 78A4 [Apostasia shenzhenica]|uniref:Cytochrome P450 78A4 n=1 Tax=Apostasia shenzhenica TaxID=1088818 RepID=A0A2I0A4B7_9ASPA|nr:Cytochrome P450 78A4 [Apostasia shenzhenica]